MSPRNRLPTAPLVVWLAAQYPYAAAPDQWGEAKWFAQLAHMNHSTMRRWMVPGATTFWWHLDQVCANLGVHPSRIYGEAWWDAARIELEHIFRDVARGRYTAEQFGIAMAERREQDHLSLRDLGRLLDVDHVLLHRIEKGVMLPGHKIQRRLIAWMRKEENS